MNTDKEYVIMSIFSDGTFTSIDQYPNQGVVTGATEINYNVKIDKFNNIPLIQDKEYSITLHFLEDYNEIETSTINFML